MGVLIVTTEREIVVSLSSDAWTYCQLFWIKESAERPECERGIYIYIYIYSPYRYLKLHVRAQLPNLNLLVSMWRPYRWRCTQRPALYVATL
jgi:hypothetical protein